MKNFMPFFLAWSSAKRFKTDVAMALVIAGMVPCVLNAYAGIKQTKDVHLWVARTFGASRMQMLFKVAIPTALPMIISTPALRPALTKVSKLAAYRRPSRPMPTMEPSMTMVPLEPFSRGAM